jgi:adenosylcobinamide kinase / adenosylcobinamide-phosphate guanylyltransferase
VLATPGRVIVDCLGTWLTAVIDEHSLWEAPGDDGAAVIDDLLDAAVSVLGGCDDVVRVTNEVGLGLRCCAPGRRSGGLRGSPFV